MGESLDYLKDHATPRQWEIISAYAKHGTYRSAGEALGISSGNVGDAIRIVKAKAARAGHAPGHFNDGVAPGFLMGKVTVQRGPNGVERTWERQSPDARAQAEMIRLAAESLARDLPRLPPVHRPVATLESLANLYTLSDYHLGMKAWVPEGGADWDIEIARQTMVGALEHMVSHAPAARLAVLNIQGDFLHTDGPEPVTPAHGHILDAAGRYGEIVDAAIEVLRRAVDLMLMRHAEVVIVFAEGNHDPRGMMFLRKMFAALYEREPRVRVDTSEIPFYALQFGKVMLGIHHGHKVKNEQLPLLFAAQFAEMWGATKKRYAHCGHRHHAEEKEHAGMTVVQHPTLAARDAYAARGGWLSERSATCITYHSEFGQVGRTFVTPEMLLAA